MRTRACYRYRWFRVVDLRLAPAQADEAEHGYTDEMTTQTMKKLLAGMVNVRKLYHVGEGYRRRRKQADGHVKTNLYSARKVPPDDIEVRGGVSQ